MSKEASRNSSEGDNEESSSSGIVSQIESSVQSGSISPQEGTDPLPVYQHDPTEEESRIERVPAAGNALPLEVDDSIISEGGQLASSSAADGANEKDDATVPRDSKSKKRRRRKTKSGSSPVAGTSRQDDRQESDDLQQSDRPALSAHALDRTYVQSPRRRRLPEAIASSGDSPRQEGSNLLPVPEHHQIVTGEESRAEPSTRSVGTSPPEGSDRLSLAHYLRLTAQCEPQLSTMFRHRLMDETSDPETELIGAVGFQPEASSFSVDDATSQQELEFQEEHRGISAHACDRNYSSPRRRRMHRRSSSTEFQNLGSPDPNETESMRRRRETESSSGAVAGGSAQPENLAFITAHAQERIFSPRRVRSLRYQTVASISNLQDYPELPSSSSRDQRPQSLSLEDPSESYVYPGPGLMELLAEDDEDMGPVSPAMFQRRDTHDEAMLSPSYPFPPGGNPSVEKQFKTGNWLTDSQRACIYRSHTVCFKYEKGKPSDSKNSGENPSSSEDSGDTEKPGDSEISGEKPSCSKDSGDGQKPSDSENSDGEKPSSPKDSGDNAKPSCSKDSEKSTVKDKENCGICFRVLHYGDDMRRLPCDHYFHKHCVDKWLKHNMVCPFCRYQMPLSPLE